ncbi:MAG TPA: hybrid sensor histidine kinase/response regulator [bacterium]|nr:hybrid sensor histidine kinase/response regulator [bacterium]HOL48163.1 hybrid sensor histidine kinase/response regulator [bacterium]HPQ17764.1 hybrid sensor histidine kinase/response regulator [bacterium]
MTDENYNLVIIDDEEANLKVLNLYIAKLKVFDKIYSYSTPQAFLSDIEKDKNKNFDAILCDYYLPMMTGLELLEKLNNMNIECEFIIMTASSELEIAIKALQLRASNFITKPINFQILSLYLNKSFETIRKRNEKKRLEELIYLQSEKMNVLGHLVNGFIHDIRNPISYIKGNCDNLVVTFNIIKEALNFYVNNNSNTEEQIKKKINLIVENYPNLIQSMKEGSDKILALLNYFHKFIFSPELEENVDVIKVIERCIDLIKFLKMKNIKLELNNRLKEEERIIKGNFSNLQMIILNILKNAYEALEYSKDPKIIINISKEDSKIIIEIIDNGPGIKKEILENLFKNIISTKGKKGSGIGLYITKKIIEDKFKGSIEILSEEGAGTTIKIALPLNK